MTSIKLDPALYESILDSLDHAVYFVDLDRRITYWNRAAEKMTGYTASEAIGRQCADAMLVHVDADGTLFCGEHCPLAACMEDGEAKSADVYLRHKDGFRVPVRIQANAIHDRSGQVIGAVESFSDSAAHVAARERIHELQRAAYVDHLTGLMNRRFVEMTIAEHLYALHRHGREFGIAFLDVDHFKQINDRYGHDVGDQLLRTVGTTLVGAVRGFDTAGRWGGDEFILVLANVDLERAVSIANRTRVLVEASGVRWRDADVKVTLSAGCTVPRPGDTAASLLKRADELMYESKAGGRNRLTSG
jgi:diguanylate cyclase (GGDEF)-like protein/PAS domain S-box-containing protein